MTDINLKKMEQQLDDALASETKESLTYFLNKHRMTDVNKLIEEEAEKYAREEWCNEQVNYYCNRLGKKDSSLEQLITQGDFKAGANFILHQNRWRKVEEEMPETNVDVLLKFDNGNVSIGVYCKDEFEEYFSCINGNEYSISEVTEWKPIE